MIPNTYSPTEFCNMNHPDNEKDFLYRKIGDDIIGLNIQKKPFKYDITFSPPIEWLEEEDKDQKRLDDIQKRIDEVEKVDVNEFFKK